MDVVADAEREIRLRPADLPLLLQEQLDLLTERQNAGISDAELAELVAELQRRKHCAILPSTPRRFLPGCRLRVDPGARGLTGSMVLENPREP